MSDVQLTSQPELSREPQEYVSAWLESIDAKARTKEAYRKNLRYYLDWLKVSGYSGTRRSDLLAYKEHLISKYEASTVSAYLTAVRVFYGWVSITYGVPDISRGIKGSKKPRGFRKDPLSVPQIKQVLEGIDRSTPEGLRDYGIVSLMAHTGMRVIEVQRADIQDLRQVMGKSILYIQGKGRDEKDDYVVIVPKVLQALTAYIKARGEKLDSTAPLFVSESDRNHGQRLTTRSLSRIVKEAFQAVGLDSAKLTAHSLRHTAVTLALAGGATVQQAQAMARHSNVNTTLIYAHNLNRLDKSAEDSISTLMDY